MKNSAGAVGFTEYYYLGRTFEEEYPMFFGQYEITFWEWLNWSLDFNGWVVILLVILAFLFWLLCWMRERGTK